jgi:dephospho-CoA kinase
MMVVGLTGSIAMGKSEVAKIFRRQGIAVFDADAEVHRLYDSVEGANLLRPLVPQAVTEDRVDRQILSNLVLADRALLDRLEKIVHAEIRRRREAFLAERRKHGDTMVLLDIPLLFETGTENDVEVSIVVSSPPQLQHKRAMARPGMTEERLAKILARQMPDAEKRARADFVIENDGDLATLERRTLELIDNLRKDAES